MSQQPLKEDKEEEDEEQGEEFVFEDSSDEENPEENQSTASDSTRSVHVSKNVDSETSQTASDIAQPVKTSPPAGQEGVPTNDVATISIAGNKFFLTGTGNKCLFTGRTVKPVIKLWNMYSVRSESHLSKLNRCEFYY